MTRYDDDPPTGCLARMTRLAFLLVPLALLPALAVAQSTPEPEPDPLDTPEVVVSDYAWTALPDEAVTVYVARRDQRLDTAYLELVIVVQQSDGTLTAVGPCDNLSTPCLPITVNASAALATVETGDALTVSVP